MNLFKRLFLDPIYDLYMHLPYIGWDGKFNSQICSHMTNLPEEHWVLEGRNECSRMIERNFDSKVVVLRSCLQLYLVVATSIDVFFLIRRKLLSFFFTSVQNDTMHE